MNEIEKIFFPSEKSFIKKRNPKKAETAKENDFDELFKEEIKKFDSKEEIVENGEEQIDSYLEKIRSSRIFHELRDMRSKYK